MQSAKWWLRPGWTLAFDGDAIVATSDIHKFKITPPPGTLADWFVRDCAPGSAVPGVSTQVVTNGDLGRALERLGAVLSDTEFDHERLSIERSRQAAYFAHIGLSPTSVAARLAASKVLLLGAGGLGSVVLQHLVGAGVGRISIVDDDVVEKSNLERQFIYTLDAVGTSKSGAAVEFVRRRTHASEVVGLERSVHNGDDLKEMITDEDVNICVVCIDRPSVAALEFPLEVCWSHGVAGVQAGVMCRSGFYGPVFDRQYSSHPPCAFKVKPTAAAAKGPTNVAFGPYNTIVGAHLAAEVLHYLANAFAYVDFENRQIVDFARGRTVRLGPGNVVKD